MPIYEYLCKKCNKVFEELQGFNDEPLTKCKECGGTLKKLISLSNFHLKGSGWYKTDYANKKQTTETESSEKDKHAESKETGESTVKSIEKETKEAKQSTS